MSIPPMTKEIVAVAVRSHQMKRGRKYRAYMRHDETVDGHVGSIAHMPAKLGPFKYDHDLSNYRVFMDVLGQKRVFSPRLWYFVECKK